VQLADHTVKRVAEQGHGLVAEPLRFGGPKRSSLGGQRALVDLVRLLGPAALVAVALAGFADPSVSRAAQTWVLGVGVIASVPHGSVDYLLARSGAVGRPAIAPAGGRFLLWYLALGAGALAVLVATPLWGLAGLVALSVVHFAEGEVADLRARYALHTRDGSRLVAAGALIAVGVVLVPLLAHPDASVSVLRIVVGRAVPVPAHAARLAALAAVGAVGLLVAADALRAGRAGVAAELAIVAAAAALAPPAVVIGVYLACWHAPRHLLRLSRCDTLARKDLLAGRTERRGGPGRRTWQLVLPLLVTVGGGVVVWAVGVPLTRLAVGGVLALTVPHSLVVAGLSRSGERR
jgi:Brp/Blh family beta-carotene 15,15'-monooxygenase